jgi:hypothetical protein
MGGGGFPVVAMGGREFPVAAMRGCLVGGTAVKEEVQLHTKRDVNPVYFGRCCVSPRQPYFKANDQLILLHDTHIPQGVPPCNPQVARTTEGIRSDTDRTHLERQGDGEGWQLGLAVTWPGFQVGVG